MKTYRYDATRIIDGIEGAAVGLALSESPPCAPGPGQVQVRIRANSLNFVDLVCFSGALPVDGRIPLLDGAGEVSAVGDGVSRFRVGDRVVGNPHASWLAGPPAPDASGVVLGIATDGMLAGTVTLPESTLAHLPESIGFEAGASLPCAGLSAWNSLRGGPARYAVAPGSTVLVQGTGGVSLFALQFARVMGCRVIATTSSSAKADTLRALGAYAVIDYVQTPDWGARVLELTDGIGVDLTVEVGGPNTLPQSIVATRVGGRIALVGIVGGMGAIDYRDMLPINHKVLTLFANGMGSRRDLEEMLRFVDVNAIEPVIDSRFAFEDAASAFRHFAARRHVGKVVISHAS